MRILYISQHFPPETGAAQGRAYEMAKNLVKLGDEVTVVTGFPNYPEGEIHDQYKGKFFQRETIDGINIIRTFLVPDTKSGTLVRLLNYITFFISSIIGGIFAKKVDVVYATSPQLLVGLSGYILSILKRAKFVLEIRDLWVDFAIHLNQITNKFMIKAARFLENFLYNRAKKIIVVTNGFKKHLVSAGINSKKIEVVTNGMDENLFKPGDKDNWVRDKYNLKDKFVVMYAGNIGTAQGLEVVINAAKRTRENSDIIYTIIGAGVEEEKLKSLAQEYELDNVKFIGSQPKEKIVDFLSAADTLLISLCDLPLFDITIPSKVFDYMAMGKSILIGVKGEARKIIEKAEAGVYFQPENDEELTEGLFKLYEDEELRAKMGDNAREYAVNNFSRFKLAEKLNKVISNIKL
ncbi:glycosyltransferase family 4 protein [Natroniella acetigena]|uniref:glycosyltransferase family 4 protein n=1 Tax=Natroniella acetigena TaxID=52004 RepID=UPI00200AFD23|nr:glycosyltransferase family 4 protein [Natroniella acetigena]MCK8827691.1 glycosyltransferase family 4 protein [Natroniella acetigena]